MCYKDCAVTTTMEICSFRRTSNKSTGSSFPARREKKHLARADKNIKNPLKGFRVAGLDSRKMPCLA